MSFIKTHVECLMLMNKYNVDGVLIVEGKEDVSYLSSFINALFFTTNGYDLNEEKIRFLKEAAKRNKLIIFTDPDEAGRKIAERLKCEINPIFEVKTIENFKKFKKKYGVAELCKNAVISSLTPFFTDKEVELIDYDLVSLISLSTDPSKAKKTLLDKYRLIDGNIKFLENELNILNINKQEVRELLSGN